MDCGNARVEISSCLDGESDEERRRALDAHLERCPDCRRYATIAGTIHRRVRLGAAQPVPPDLTAGVLAAIGHDGHDARTAGLRVGLAAVGAVQVMLAVPALFLGDDASLPTHTARHVGSFAFALGIALLVAAWQPRRVGGILPLIATLVACLFVSSVIDVLAGNTGVWAELGAHATEFVGLGLVWFLALHAGQAGSLLARLHLPRGAHP